MLWCTLERNSYLHRSWVGNCMGLMGKWEQQGSQEGEHHQSLRKMLEKWQEEEINLERVERYLVGHLTVLTCTPAHGSLSPNSCLTKHNDVLIFFPSDLFRMQVIVLCKESQRPDQFPRRSGEHSLGERFVVLFWLFISLQSEKEESSTEPESEHCFSCYQLTLWINGERRGGRGRWRKDLLSGD